ncbi:SdrD B-like domain-containing protein [Hyphomonas sp.]|uniref:SdrD B-like domain-containing protein n=1 Tax=Hyphomonas sp. TaxID=87 RepID=UPI003527B72A
MASAADLAVSRFQVVSPTGDIYRGADVTFEVDLDNNDLTPVSDAQLQVDVPATMVVQPANVPAGCSASGFTAPQTLTCSLPTLTRDAANPDLTFTFIATAETANALTGTVTISSPTNTDPNPGNDSLSVTPTVGSGADLAMVLSASTNSLPAGGRFSYVGTVTNNGPDSVNAAEVVFSLPPSADFGYVSSTGSNWSCVQSGGGSQTVTCAYSGPAIASGAGFPAITLTGDADIPAGTLSALADVTVTQIGLGDPDLNNNTDGPEVVTITPGTDLQARIIIASSFITGETGTFTLRINNNGPTSIAGGAQIVHVLSPNLGLNGPLPAGCSEAPVGTITCTAGAINTGALENFVIPIAALSDTGGNQVISATVTPPAGLSDPVPGNDTGNDTFRIDDPAADVFMQSKTKTPNPVQAGQNMTSTIRIENNGPSIVNWSPANPIVITDDLGPNETYVSTITTGWTCVTGASPDAGYVTRVTCTTTDSGSIAVDARKTLQIVTQAGSGADVDITNNACVDVSGLSVADPNTGNNCLSRTSRATTEEANLALVAEVSLSSSGGFSPAVTVPDATGSHFIRLTVSNAAGSDTARTVDVRTFNLGNWMNTTVNFNGGSVNHATSVSVFSADAGITCPTLATVNDDLLCRVTNLVAGETRTIILQVDRPILEGLRTTAFSITSPDTIETNTSDNNDSVSVTAEANADLIVDDKRVSPNPPQSGGTATYLVDIKNIGPNAGSAVATADFIDPARFEVLNVTTTAPGGVCDYGTTTPDTATCTIGTMTRGQSYQMAITVRPRFPFAGAVNPGDFPVSHTNTATVTTTTLETNSANNSRPLTHDVGAPSLDMRVTNAEPSGFAEPAIYGSTLLYEINTRNGGLTQGSSVTTTVSPNPQAGYEMAYNAGASTVPAGVSCSQASNTDPVICTYPNMSNGDNQTVILAFTIVDAGGGAPVSSITFGTTAVVTSDQQAFDTPTANNTAAQTTTVIPSTDLEVVSKTRIFPAPPTPINIAEPVTYDIVFRNNGVSATTQVRITDTLPTGFVRTATPVVFTPSGSATVSGSTCSTGNSVLCVVDGFFPANGDTVTMRIEAAATFPFSGNVNDPIVNLATIAVGQTAGGNPISIDEVPGNNAQSTSDGTLRVSSISGRVYSDNDMGDSFTAGEGIGSVTLTLTGTDLYGNTINTTVQTAADGSYSFADLPPSNGAGYTITETQPANHVDYRETAGSAGGTVDNSAFGTGAAFNAISAVVLAEGVDETGYEFANYRFSSISGSIYSDANNNGTLDGGDAGIGSGYAATPHLSLTGTDFAGNPVNLTTSVNGSGVYSFDGLAPSDGTGYTVTQLQEPSGFYDGQEENGSGVILPSSVDGSEQILSGVVLPATVYGNRNFGQVAVSSFAGLIYVDTNGDGTRQGGETGTFPGATIQLTGTDDLGRSISCTATSAADGSYGFPVAACPQLRPGTYQIRLTATPDRSQTGSTVGTAGGTQGASATPGYTSHFVSSITLGAGTDATDYLFGVTDNAIIANNNDFTASPIVGADGGVTASVFPNDTINGLTFADAAVVPSVTNTGGLTGVSINADGTLSVPAGTPAGPYTVTYQICETVNPTNCDTATVDLVVTAAAIVANDNDFTSTPVTGSTGGATPSVFPDDRLNGAVFADSAVTPSLTSDGGLTGVSINPDGTLSVPAATPAGTYTVGYQICEVLNPANCDPATATVVVGASAITANDDDFTASPINGADGGTTASVFPDDRLNGAVFANGDVTSSITADGGLTGVSINADGTLTVPAATPAGTYSVGYQICEVLNPANCDPATATVVINPPAIVANDNDFTSSPINGADGGATASVYPDDTLNGSAFADTAVTPSITADGGLTGASINPDGTLSVPAATPAGTYTVGYQICEVLNPANCDPATATVVISAATIDANDNNFASTPINGFDGGTTPSVFPDDRLNGAVFADADVTPTLVSDGGLTGVSINPDGTLSVPAATPAGTYTVGYQICEVLNPANCDPAIATIVVNPPNILGVSDDFTSTPIVGALGGNTPNAFPNDLLNGAPFAPGAVTATILSDGGLTGVGINPDGTLTVPAGTPAGPYSVNYEICEVLNPTNCDTSADVALLITASVIEANDDDFTPGPINGADGGSTASVLADDTLNGVVLTPADITLTTVSGDSELTLDPVSGVISVAPGTPAGTYTLTYQICENLNPANCDSALATVVVTPPAIVANDNDFTSSPINGADGGATASVYPDDTLNGSAFADTAVTPSITADGGLTGASINPDGTLSVPAATPAGTYTVGYQICEVLNPANCDPATATVMINPPAIVANDDDFTPAPINGAEGGSTASVLVDDTLNGVVLTPADITLTTVSGDSELTLDPVNGVISVAPGTPAGPYTLTYQICENLNPANCDIAIATVSVEAAPIAANDDDYTATPLNGSDGGTLPSVFADDTLNAASFADTDVTASLTADGGLTGAVLNPDGTLTVPAGTPAGTYTLTYQICEVLNPTNCDTAAVTVVVEAAPIVANDDDYTATPVNGADGATLPGVLTNDTLNGAAVSPSDIQLTLTDADGLNGAAIAADGTLTVPADTPAGTYQLVYQICEVLNPANCDSAVATVLVEAAPIVANDNDYSATPVNGADGATLPSVFDNDTLNGAGVTPADVTASITDTDGLTGAVINPDGTITVPAGSIAGTYTLTYEICEVLNPSNCDTAAITITIVTDASLAGTVFLDANADDTLQSAETRMPGYIVQLRSGGVVIATMTTGADGSYAFTGLDPDLTYEVVFIEAASGTVVDIIDGIDLQPGEDRTGLDEPVAPSGTVYDVATNQPVVGGTVTVVDEAGTPLPVACFADPSQQDQVTGLEGYYFFDLVAGGDAACPASGGTYRIAVTLPNGLAGVFAAAPLDVNEGALETGVCLNDALAGPVCEVSASPLRPDASQLAPFYARFAIRAGDPEFANNHIPVNSAISQAPLTATKRALSANASVGSVVVYTITVANEFDVPQIGVDIVDQLPAGLVFIAGSGRVNGDPVEPLVDGRMLTWQAQTVPARGAVEITLGVAVGSGVTVGEYVNTAYADNGVQDVILSNIAEATIRITPDEVFDCSEVLGKVFEDTNRNGIQDEGERGLPGVRLATVKGLLVTTDEFGRYHIACAATPKAGIGSNFILKLDERTLPTGFDVTTENPRVIRLTQGKMSQLDFGVGALRPVEFQLRPDAFLEGRDELAPDAAADLVSLVEVLMEERSILSITYIGAGEGSARLARVKAELEALWSEQDAPYELIIETEVVSSRQNP